MEENQKPATGVTVTEAPAPAPKVKMTKIERKKYRVINRLIAGEINGPKAAKMLELTTRQIRNLKRQVMDTGAEGVVHKNHFYKPYNTYDLEISDFIVKLYRKEFKGVNFSEFARIVQEEYGVKASRSTIYNFLRRSRIRSPQRKKKKKKTLIQATEVVVIQPTATTPDAASAKAQEVSHKA